MEQSQGNQENVQPIKQLTTQERKAILDTEIENYVMRGFRVLSRTETSAQLVKPKRFSWLWALVWFLLAGVGIFVYIGYFLLKGDKQRYISVQEDGSVAVM